MDFCFASLVLVASIGVVLFVVQMLTWRSTRAEVRATRAELLAFQNNLFSALRLTHGSMEVLTQMLNASPAERFPIELPPDPLSAPPRRERVPKRQRPRRMTPMDRMLQDIPDRLDELLRYIGRVEVPPEEIPLWLRFSDHPLELQKLAVFLQKPRALRPEPGVAPEPFDPRWVQVLANLSRTKPDATLVEINDEYERLELEDSAAHPALKPGN